MDDQNEPQHQPVDSSIKQSAKASEQKALDRLIERLPVPPKYRTRKWVFGALGAAVVLIIVLIQCDSVGGSEPYPLPATVAVPTPTPEPTAIPREEYQLPRQYAFAHFVNEMAACYDQHGQPSTLEVVEVDIMHDVPAAVGTLMRLYADNACEEVEPWHQIPGRAGWMLRASGVDEYLPQPEPEEEEPK